MKTVNTVIIFILILTAVCTSSTYAGSEKARIIIVSSYHKEYLWSQDTNQGIISAFLKFGYLDNSKQAEEFTKNDFMESSKAVIKKLWMDTKRKSTLDEIEGSANNILKEIKNFSPDLIMLGDDNATNFIGNQYIDSKIPVVFWGVNGMPLKYGLLDSIEKPGHNITGVYQSGYLKETSIALKKLLPNIKTFAILSDASETGRSKVKELIKLSETGEIPIELIGTVMTDSLSEWKSKALEFDKKVDSFFVLNHNTLKDDNGKAVDQLEIGKWYLQNIKKPDAAHEKQFITEGILCAVDDSGYRQGYEAVKMAYQILTEKKNPAEMASYSPEKGPFMVNRERAKMLGLNDLLNNSMVEEYVEKALALGK